MSANPDPIDVFVGARVRERRVLLGLSQTALGKELGITFQQVQKYEKGSNRLSASTLYRTAEILDVPISFFFDGVAQATGVRILPVIAPDRGDVSSALRLAQRMRRLSPGAVAAMVAFIDQVAPEAADQAAA